MYFFTTLTQFSEVPKNSLTPLLKSISNKYLYVHEHGKKGDNHHVHIIFYDESDKRTDKYTAKFQKLYNGDFIKKLPKTHHLVKTKKAKNWKKLFASYLCKESQNSDFKNLTFEGFEESILRKLFKESTAQNLIKKRIYVSLINAPFYMLEYSKEHKLSIDYVAILWHMGTSGDYIVHHLFDNRTLSKIEVGWDMLQKKEYSPYSLEKYLT